MTWRMKMHARDAEMFRPGLGGTRRFYNDPPDWRAALPAEMQADPSLKDFKDVASLAKSYVETKSHLGNSIRIPSDKAGPDDLKAFREKLKTAVPDLIELPADAQAFEAVEGSIFERLGRPKDVKGYQTPKEAGISLPEGVEVNEEALRAYAAKVGLTKKQYAVLLTEAVAEQTKRVQLTGEQRKALKTELGDAFDERLTAAAAAAKKMGKPDEYVQALRRGAVSADDAKAWINVAKSMGTEPGDLGGHEGGGSSRLTPAEARNQIDELYKHPALKEKGHPRHNEMVIELHRLTGIAYA